MILDKIVRHKKTEVTRLKSSRQYRNLEERARSLPCKPGSFVECLKNDKYINVIAEIKKKSPSKGVLCENFDPVWIARQYEKGGASALSVLTDRKFFAGSPAIFKKVREATPLPLLRKEFIIDEVQVYESKIIGADAILLIARILSTAEIERFSKTAESLGLDILYEIHDEADWSKVKKLAPRMVGINNRDLDTFTVDLKTTELLACKIGHAALLVAESGIASFGDIEQVKAYGARAILVGESLMKQKNPGMALRSLLKKSLV